MEGHSGGVAIIRILSRGGASMRSLRKLTTFIILLCTWTGPAWPGPVIDIFQRSNQPEICSVRNGVDSVDPGYLAAKMVAASSIGADLQRQADPIGLLTRDAPFGSGPSATTPQALAAAQRLLAARMELTGFLALGGSKQQGYEVVNLLPRVPTSDDFFLQPDKVMMKCIRQVVATQPDATRHNLAAAALAKRLLVRSEVSELTLNQDQIAGIKGTTFSYAHDQVKGSDTVVADGVVGWKLMDFSGQHRASVIPFFRYKSTSNEPNNTSQFIEPGVLVDAFYNGDRIAATAGLNLSRIIDNSDNSDQSNLSAFIIPSFRIPFGASDIVLFGGYMRPIGPLSLRPELKLMTAGRQIDSAGTNAALQGKDSYFGIGFDMRIDMLLVGVPLFQKLRGYVEYTGMENFGVRDVELFKAGLIYPLLDSDRMSLNLDYANGRDIETLLENERYTLGLAFRY